MGGEKMFVYVHAKLFWRAIYYANPRPDARYKSESRSHRGLVSQSTCIICEYKLATKIVIQLLIHPCTCEMDSFIFAAMIQLKFASTTRTSFTNVPSKEKQTEKNDSIALGIAYHDYYYLFFTNNQVAYQIPQTCSYTLQCCQFSCQL